MKELTCEQCGKRVDGVSELWLHYGKCPNGIKAVYTNNSQLKGMTDEDKNRIKVRALDYYLDKYDFRSVAETPDGKRIIEKSYEITAFKAGAEYEHPIAYEAGFQDGFKKMDNELYNQAIEDVIAKISITMDPVFGTAVISEIQKLKKP